MITLQTDKFIYFDEAGEILAVRSTNKEPGNFIQVKIEQIESLITGKEMLNSYMVIFDTVTKQNVLRHKFIEDEIQFNINNQIYEIPRADVIRPDFTIQQDISNKKWVLKLDSVVKDYAQTVSYDTPIALSITARNDPHQLERYIIVALKELVKQDYEMSFDSELELDPNGISVYTTKRLETYYHEVLE